MMKRIRNTIILIILMSLIIMPLSVNAAKEISQNQTLGELKNNLKEYEKQAQDNKNKKQKTKSEIEANKRQITNAENELMQTKEKITATENQIEYTNNQIEKLKKESSDILIQYQKQKNENIYVSYLTGASSITDLIMRLDAISTITDYNNEKLDSLDTLIKNSKKMNKELENYQVKLDKNIVAYEAAQKELQDEMSELEEGAVTIADEIKNLKEWIKIYQDMGCKDSELLSKCINTTDNSRWLKPLTKGRITSLYGPRAKFAGSSSNYHKGIDIGVAEGTNVYPTANGVVGAIVYPTTQGNRCGGKKLFIWTVVNGKKYTYVYMHLMQIKVKVGDKVTTNQIVALSGGGPKANQTNALSDNCTTGAHLHYGLAYGGWWGYNPKTEPLSGFYSHTMNPPGFPGLHQWFYSRY